MVRDAAEIFTKSMKDGQARHHAWNNAGIYLMRAAKVQSFANANINALFRFHRIGKNLKTKMALSSL